MALNWGIRRLDLRCSERGYIMGKIHVLFRVAVAAFVVATAIVATAAPLPSFSQSEGVPDAPAAFAFDIASGVLGDGRFVLWDGDTVLVEAAVDSDEYEVLATGYAGDPGFLAVAPDGHTLILGTGFTGDFFLLDADAPQPPGDPLATETHSSCSIKASSSIPSTSSSRPISC
jgi:hypothetical protein